MITSNLSCVVRCSMRRNSHLAWKAKVYLWAQVRTLVTSTHRRILSTVATLFILSSLRSLSFELELTCLPFRKPHKILIKKTFFFLNFSFITLHGVIFVLVSHYIYSYWEPRTDHQSHCRCLNWTKIHVEFSESLYFLCPVIAFFSPAKQTPENINYE